MKRILLVSLVMTPNFLYPMYLSKPFNPSKTLSVHSRCNAIPVLKSTAMMSFPKLNLGCKFDEVRTFNSSTKMKILSRKETNLVQKRLQELKTQLDKENKEIKSLEEKIDFSIEASFLFYSNLPRISLLAACKSRKMYIEKEIFNLELISKIKKSVHGDPSTALKQLLGTLRSI